METKSQFYHSFFCKHGVFHSRNGLSLTFNGLFLPLIAQKRAILIFIWNSLKSANELKQGLFGTLLFCHVLQRYFNNICMVTKVIINYYTIYNFKVKVFLTYWNLEFDCWTVPFLVWLYHPWHSDQEDFFKEKLSREAWDRLWSDLQY